MTSLGDLLSSLDARTHPFEEHDVFRELTALAETELCGSSESVKWELLAFRFHEIVRAGGVSDEAYFESTRLHDSEAGTLCFPDPRQITPEVLEYWMQRARASAHPIMKYRYALLVWSFSGGRGRKRNHLSAPVVVQSALDLAGRGDYPDEVIRLKLARARRLATLVRNDASVSAVAEAMIEFARRRPVGQARRNWIYCCDVLMNPPSSLSKDHEAKIVAALEAELAHATQASVAGCGDPYPAKEAAQRLAHVHKIAGRTDDHDRVVLLAVEALRQTAQQAGPIYGAGWMREAYDMASEHGLKERANSMNPDLERMGRGLIRSLPEQRFEFQVPGESLDAIRSEMIKRTLGDGLYYVADLFLPRRCDVERRVKASAQSHMLQAIFGRTILDASGRVSAEVGGVEDDLEGRVVVQLAREARLVSAHLRHALKVLLDTHSVTSEMLADALCPSPAFVEQQRGFLEHATSAYLDEDYVTFVHVAIPQIEASIRNLVIAGRGKHLATHAGGGLVLTPLGALLREPVLVEALGENGPTYLNAILADQRGWNLRNLVCHGFGELDSFTIGMADRLLHCVLLIGLFPLREGDSDSASPPDQHSTGKSDAQ